MVLIPEPKETDADDVSLALDVAKTQWGRGDQGEALKWLRKAADAAFDADDDARGMELSKLAADISTQIGPGAVQPQPSQIPPPAAAAPAAPAPVMPPPTNGSPPPNHGTVPMPSGTPAPAPAQVAAPKPLVPPPGSIASGPKKRPPRPSHPAPAEAPVARPRPSRPAPPVASRPPKPTFPRSGSPEEDEATREYVLPQGAGSAANTASGVSDVNWPTETSLELEESISDSTIVEAKKPRAAAGSIPKPGGAAKKKAKRSLVPYTRAIRVAARRGAKGEVIVRLLDASGVRAGEHDTILVALTSNEDLRKLFEP